MTRARDCLRYLLLLLVLPNLIFFLIGLVVFVARPVVNVDYLLLGVVWPWLATPIAILGFGLILTADFLMAFAPSFHFKPAGLVQSVQDAFNLDPTYGGSVALVLIVLFSTLSLIIGWVLRKPTHRVWVSAVMLVSGVLAVAADVMLSSNAYGNHDRPVIPVNLATSALYNVARGIRSTLNSKTSAITAHEIPAASQILFDRMSKAPGSLPPHIVMVVVESMGLYLEPAANILQMSALNEPALAERYLLESGTVPYQGSTVPGELRELCRIQVSVTHPDPAILPTSECLPARLSVHGYQSLAVHGFTGSFFDRRDWYPALGFDQVLFIHDVDRTLGHASRCGVSFPGACDTEIADFLGGRLRNNPPPLSFTYWLTLNAHLPVYAPPKEQSLLDCRHSNTTQDAAQCHLMKQHDVVLRSLIRNATHIDMPRTAFIIVGDHTPPFLSNRARGLFDGQRVPYFILWPRSDRAFPDKKSAPSQSAPG